MKFLLLLWGFSSFFACIIPCTNTLFIPLCLCSVLFRFCEDVRDRSTATSHAYALVYMMNLSFFTSLAGWVILGWFEFGWFVCSGYILAYLFTYFILFFHALPFVHTMLFISRSWRGGRKPCVFVLITLYFVLFLLVSFPFPLCIGCWLVDVGNSFSSGLFRRVAGV